MALQIKCDLFLNNNEIIITDVSGHYSLSNTSGWSHPLMNGSSPLTATVIDDSLNVLIESIVLDIDGTSIIIESGTNEGILPTELQYITSPEDLVFTINANTYPTYYADFVGFTDGTHDITYTINFTLASGYPQVSYTTQFFTYKEVEAEMWAIFHDIAHDHNNIRLTDAYITKALYAKALFKGLEYAARTSTDLAKAEEILATLTKILDFKNVKSY